MLTRRKFFSTCESWWISFFVTKLYMKWKSFFHHSRFFFYFLSSAWSWSNKSRCWIFVFVHLMNQITLHTRQIGNFYLSRGQSKSISFTKKLKKYRRRNTCLSILLEPVSVLKEEVLYDRRGRDYFSMELFSKTMAQRNSRNRVWKEFEKKSSQTIVIAILQSKLLLEFFFQITFFRHIVLTHFTLQIDCLLLSFPKLLRFCLGYLFFNCK